MVEALQVEYKRDMQSSYLVIQTEEIPDNTYRILMLLNNRIEGLLEMELRSVDDKNVYYYEISSKQSFACLYEKRTITCAELKKMIHGLISIINRGKEYLLEENDYVIKPEYMYMSLPACDLHLCYLPGYQRSMRIQLSELFEVLMNKVDYKEEKAVLLIYALYMASKEESCTFETLLNLIREQGEDTEKLESADQKPESVVGKEMRIQPFSSNPMFLSDAGRKKYRVVGMLGAVIALVLAVYVAGEFTGGGMEMSRLIVGAGLTLTAAGASGYAFYLSVQRQRPQIQPLILNIENELERISVGENEADENDLFEILREEAEKGLESCNLVNRESLENDRTIMLSDFTKEEYYLTPAGRHTDERQLLNEFPYYIGKWKEHVNLLLEDNAVSRFHAKITEEEDGYYVTDLNSTNGTFVNRSRLQPNEKRKLNVGDEIAFAGKKYQFLAM